MLKKERQVFLRLFVWCFLVVSLTLSAVAPVLADMGEKPSVTLKIINAPAGPYAAALFVKGEPHKEEELKRFSDQWEKLADGGLRHKVLQLEADGYRVAEHPGGSLFIYTTDDDYRYFQGAFKFTYYAPSTFKACVATADFSIISDNEITSSRYACKAIFDASTGELYEDLEAYEEADRKVWTRSLYFLMATLIVEGIFLLIFGLAHLRNFVIFLIMNVLTQAYLHYTVWAYRVDNGSGLGASIHWAGTELMILIIETLVYTITMKEKNGKRWKCFLYGIVANILSAFCSFLN